MLVTRYQPSHRVSAKRLLYCFDSGAVNQSESTTNLAIGPLLVRCATRTSFGTDDMDSDRAPQVRPKFQFFGYNEPARAEESRLPYKPHDSNLDPLATRFFLLQQN